MSAETDNVLSPVTPAELEALIVTFEDCIKSQGINRHQLPETVAATRIAMKVAVDALLRWRKENG